MLIDISNIGPDGLSVSGELPLETLPLEGGLEARLTRPRVEARLTSSSRGVLLRGHLETRVTLTCVRCLVPFEHPLSREFHLTLVQAAEAEDRSRNDEETTESDEVDLFPLEGTRFDLTDMVREQVDLALPMNPVCRNECRGLCAQCGADLNRGPCNCPTAPKDPRWAALAGWRGSKDGP